MTKSRGVLAVLSGFSGAGKGTVVKRLVEKYDNFALSISATTRKPREGEVDGREYFFKTVEEFEDMIANKQLIEYAKYVNNYYGTPKEFVEKMLDEGKDVILEIELQGALQVKEIMPDTVLIFVTPPTAEELERRLIGRGTEDIETVNKRLARAYEESAYMEKYDYILINDVVEDCVEDLNSIFVAEHNMVSNNQNLITSIRNEVRIFQNK